MNSLGMDLIERQSLRIRVMSFFILVVVFSRVRGFQERDCQIFPANYSFRTTLPFINQLEINTTNCTQEGDYTTCYHPSTLTDSVIGGDNVFRTMRITGTNFQNHNYYLWENCQIYEVLFTFPSETTLTGITLYYYSDSDRNGGDRRNYGLPRLDFTAVEDDFELQSSLHDPTVVLFNTGPPEEGEVDGTNKTIHFNLSQSTPTRKVLLNKMEGNIRFALSEIKFFGKTDTTCTSTFSSMTTSNEDNSQEPLSPTTPGSSSSAEPTMATTNIVDITVTAATMIATKATSTNIYIVIPTVFVLLILFGLAVILIVIFVLLKHWKSAKDRKHQETANTGESVYDLPNEPAYDTIPEPVSIKITENEAYAYGPLPSSHGPGHAGNQDPADYELVMSVSETVAAISMEENAAYTSISTH